MKKGARKVPWVAGALVSLVFLFDACSYCSGPIATKGPDRKRLTIPAAMAEMMRLRGDLDEAYAKKGEFPKFDNESADQVVARLRRGGRPLDLHGGRVILMSDGAGWAGIWIEDPPGSLYRGFRGPGNEIRSVGQQMTLSHRINSFEDGLRDFFNPPDPIRVRFNGTGNWCFLHAGLHGAGPEGSVGGPCAPGLDSPVRDRVEVRAVDHYPPTR